jgi:hypothetical protein
MSPWLVSAAGPVIDPSAIDFAGDASVSVSGGCAPGAAHHLTLIGRRLFEAGKRTIPAICV